VPPVAPLNLRVVSRFPDVTACVAPMACVVCFRCGLWQYRATKKVAGAHADSIWSVAWAGPSRLVTGSLDEKVKTWYGRPDRCCVCLCGLVCCAVCGLFSLQRQPLPGTLLKCSQLQCMGLSALTRPGAGVRQPSPRCPPPPSPPPPSHTHTRPPHTRVCVHARPSCSCVYLSALHGQGCGC
jgi:hypothetical protein